MQVGPHRPTSVTVLAILAVILAALSIIIGLSAVLLGFAVASYSGVSASILDTLGTVVIAFGVLEIVYGVGFLDGKGWSWTLGMGVAVVSLASSIGAIELSATAGPAELYASAVILFIPFIAIIPIITSSVTIFFLTRPHVKAFFGKGHRPQAQLRKYLSAVTLIMAPAPAISVKEVN